MTHAQQIATQLKIREPQVAATIQLFDEGNTLPFVARYRKEATGGLDEEQLRNILDLLESLRKLDERRATVIASIEEQGKMTSELRTQLNTATTLTALEDLYQPYKPKRRTRASMAREKGLQLLADQILAQPRGKVTLEGLAAAFVNENVASTDEAWAGARDIVAETVSDHPDVRRVTRDKALKLGTAKTGKVENAQDEKQVYALYYDFNLRIDRLRPHQVLAINRGEAQKVLRVAIDVPEHEWRSAVDAVFRPHPLSPLAEQMEVAISDAAERLLLPAIERDVRRELTEQAAAQAIRVFGANLRGLLTQPPLAGHTVLALDPGFRTGCKVAVTDPSGKVLETATIYPHQPLNQKRETLKTLSQLVQRHGVTLITVGNGTASRETEQVVAELIRGVSDAAEERTSARGSTSKGLDLHYLIVNEAGASVYSASPLARSELPDLDVSIRGAVSLARRVQDPLAELVKIDPKAIGVGMYQHDVDQKQLAHALDGVVESVVNQVGVDVNTASPALLTYVAGIGPKLAEKIVEHRNTQGPFRTRKTLRDVAGLGPKAFEQAAGFMRIRGGDEPLDSSAIHPESYAVAYKVLQRASLTSTTPLRERENKLAALKNQQPLAKLALELGAGEPTLVDIFDQLLRPGRDPREDVPPPLLRSDVLSVDDLVKGMELDGTVRNVVDFGAFVDIGVKQDGLIHRSQIPYGTVLNVGDIVKVEIVTVEKERGRIGLGWPGKVQAQEQPKAKPKVKVDWAVGESP